VSNPRAPPFRDGEKPLVPADASVSGTRWGREEAAGPPVGPRKEISRGPCSPQGGIVTSVPTDSRRPVVGSSGGKTASPGVAPGGPSTTATQGSAPNPVLKETQDLLDRGDYRAAVRYAYRAAFDDTLRAFGVEVAAARTDRQFFHDYLREDMGKLVELLPALYRFYEPVRYGRTGGPPSAEFRPALERLYAETALGLIRREQYRPTIPTARPSKALSTWPYRPLPEKKNP